MCYRLPASAKGKRVPHPVVVIVAAKFADSAGREFGEALGKGFADFLFNGGSSSSSQLRRLSNQLAELNRKIDYLTRLVEQLPQVVARAIEQNTLDTAYRTLESSRDVFLAGDGSPLVNEQDKVELLTAWRNVVDLESHTTALVRLPEWSEYVRARLGTGLTDTIRKHFALLVGRVEFAVEEKTKELDRVVLAAVDLGDDEGRRVRYFRRFSATPDPITFSFELEDKKVPTIEVPMGGQSGSDRTVQDESWLRSQRSRVERIRAFQATARKHSEELGVLITVRHIAKDYLAALPAAAS